MNNNNSTYKRLGDYIREVNIRNKDLSVTKLMGINIEKYFMPSVANVIGTDMTNYKVVANGQFACNLMHVGRDEKIPVALNTEDSIIVSPAYFVFEVCNKALLPEYLELSFRNPEFDRNAWFHTDADVRGGMDKDGMKDLLIPVPPIEEQRSIVNRYKAIENRIANNKQTIAKLEEAAQALYRKMFVDGIDVENLPEGWRMGCLGEVVKSTLGGDWGKEIQEGNYTQLVSCVRGADINNAKLANFKETPQRYILEKNLASRQLSEGDIVIEISGGTPTQSTGRSVLFSETILNISNNPLICSNFCRIIKPKKRFSEYLYSTLKYLYDMNVFFRYENSSNGIQNLDLDAIMKEENLFIPNTITIEEFSIKYNTLAKEQIMLGVENEKLIKMLSLMA